VLAFPQDDYDHAAVLDDWLDDLGASHVFTALPQHAAGLYPRISRNATIHGVLTGYVDEDAVETVHFQTLGRRPLDVVYRAARLPYWFGRLGALKTEVASAAAGAAARLSLRVDIDVGDASVITGERWFQFLGSGRVVLGSESGASVIDRDGSVRAAVLAYLAARPAASYDEVRAHVPANWDAHWLGAISPRHFEAAIARTPQALVRGSYSGVLRADDHYVPIESDLSNMDEAIAAALDPAVGTALAERAHADLVESRQYSYERFSGQIREVLAVGTGAGSTRLLWLGRAASAAGAARALLASIRR
jgi:hypothetical protein